MRIGRGEVAGQISLGSIDAGGFQPVTSGRDNEYVAVGPRVPLATVNLLSPVTPGVVLSVLRAFRQSDNEVVDRPPYLILKRAGTGLAGPSEPIRIPASAQAPIMAEAELALVIGQLARNLSVEDAWEAIAGFTIMNDVTAVGGLSSAGTGQ